MKKFIFMIVALMGMVMSVNAQTVESSRFTDNWSVGLKGGAVTPLNHSAFWGDMRGVVGLELKKEVTPILGLGVEGEWTVNTSAWSRNVHSTNVFDHQLVGGFLTGNLTNAIAGYRGTPRLVEVEAVAGLGWLHAYLNGTEDTNGWYTKFGANVNFNLGTERAWVVSFKPAIVYDMDGGAKTNFNLNRAYLELQVGVAYRFKNHNGTHSFVLCNKKYTQDEYNALMSEVNDLRARDTATTVEYVEKEVVREKVTDNTTITNAIGFTINSAVLSETSYANLANIAAWLKANDSVNIVIKGYADKNTGTAAYNKDLATRRAEAVKNVLVNTFGVSANRITTEGVGVTEQPYGTNNWNRVAVFSVNK